MNRSASAVWRGTGRDGKGTLTTQSGVLDGAAYAFTTRFENEAGTNPEELIAAAHAGCFAMQLSHFLAENGTPARRLEAKALVTLVPGTGITGSALSLTADVPGLADAAFQQLAEKAKASCPVSLALGAIAISLTARLA